MNKFKTANDSQLFLLPPSVEEFVPEGHLARVIDEVVETLNTKPIEDKYSLLGQKSYHPKSIIKLLFYGYSIGVMSGRKIAQQCESDTAFMFLARMYRPDFRTINDFRKNNLDQIENYFLDIVRLCKGLGMVKSGTIIIDSTKIRANASSDKMYNKATYEHMQMQVDEQIKDLLKQAEQTDAEEDAEHGDSRGDELPQELRTKKQLKEKIKQALEQLQDEKAKSNLTDPDARIMKSRDVFRANYCCQAAMSEDGIVVGAYATTTSSDRAQLLKVINESEKMSQSTFPVAVADSGYSSYEIYKQAEEEGRIVFMPDQELISQQLQAATDKYHRLHFRYDEESKEYICPEGKSLPFFKLYNKEKTGQKRIVYRGTECHNCHVKQSCTQGTQRQISTDVRDQYRLKARERLKTQIGQRMQKLRRCTIERLFGHIKHNLKFTMFQLRRLNKVNGEFKMVCMAYNLRTLHKLKAGLV